ncbi:MAG: DNA-binding protein [Geobacteraceae bacterium]
MKTGRLLFLVVLFGAGLLVQPTISQAFWGFGDDTTRERSGLDFDRGYDRNTETTVQGRVVSVDPGEGSGLVMIILRQGARELSVVAAPAWYWSDGGISVKPKDELVVTGSKAQGKDGKIYLISRVIINQSDSESVTLRDESGKPDWHGGARMRSGAGGFQHRMGGGGRRR